MPSFFGAISRNLTHPIISYNEIIGCVLCFVNAFFKNNENKLNENK